MAHIQEAVGPVEQFAADAAACSRRLQSRQRAFADDIALELGLLQLPAKR
jgi:hypothetical protein